MFYIAYVARWNQDEGKCVLEDQSLTHDAEDEIICSKLELVLSRF